jgi:4-hydroxy-tetrahydrodipicolinate synthase
VVTARTIKLEDPPTPLKIARVLEQSGSVTVSVFGGLGGVYLLEELMAGASGAMTGFAVPEVLVKVVRLFSAGDVRRAAEVFYGGVALMRFEFQEGIGMAVRKEILRRRGALATSTVRMPGPSIDPGTLAALDSVLQWFQQQQGDIQWTLD